MNRCHTIALKQKHSKVLQSAFPIFGIIGIIGIVFSLQWLLAISHVLTCFAAPAMFVPYEDHEATLAASNLMLFRVWATKSIKYVHGVGLIWTYFMVLSQTYRILSSEVKKSLNVTANGTLKFGWTIALSEVAYAVPSPSPCSWSQAAKGKLEDGWNAFIQTKVWLHVCDARGEANQSILRANRSKW